jgi:hypothetical protein
MITLRHVYRIMKQARQIGKLSVAELSVAMWDVRGREDIWKLTRRHESLRRCP